MGFVFEGGLTSGKERRIMFSTLSSVGNKRLLIDIGVFDSVCWFLYISSAFKEENPRLLFFIRTDDSVCLCSLRI